MDSDPHDVLPAVPAAASDAVPSKDLPLERLLDQAEQVQGKVEECAMDLSEVNALLKHQVGRRPHFLDVVGALEQSSEIEVKVHEAAADLVAVNDALAAEVEERQHLEEALVQSHAALSVSHTRELRARHDALHDVLTGLPNARLFTDRLELAIAQAARHDWQIAVMFIDLDAFKQINDTHGHHMGDQVLCLVAERLQGALRAGDTVCRRSGDEFLLLLLESHGRASAEGMARAILDTLSAPCVIDGVALALRASLGIAMYPADGETPLALLRHADTAMYGVKRTPAAAQAAPQS